jgi:hypothetical protein
VSVCFDVAQDVVWTMVLLQPLCVVLVPQWQWQWPCSLCGMLGLRGCCIGKQGLDDDFPRLLFYLCKHSFGL